MRSLRSGIVSAVAVSAAWGELHAASTTVLVAKGQTAPGGDGTITEVTNAIVNNNGKIYFEATLTGTSLGSASNFGRYVINGATTKVVSRKGDTVVPGKTIGGLQFTGSSAFHDDGSATIYSSFGGTTSGFGLFEWKDGAVTAQASSGQAAPGFTNTTIGDVTFPYFNSSGQAVFAPSLAAGNSTLFNAAIYRSTGSVLTTIVKTGQNVPGISSTFTKVEGPQLNDTGDVAFFGTYTGSFEGIFSGNGGALKTIARAGQTAPGTSIPITSFIPQSPKIDNAGYATFNSFYTAAGQSSFGIFRGNGTTTALVAGRGQAAAGSNGIYSNIGQNQHSVNRSGQVVFQATVSGATDGSNGNGLFLATGSNVDVLANASTPVPGGNGKFSSFFRPLISDDGSVAFLAQLSGTTGGTTDNYGLFMSDPQGRVTTVARAGDAMLGSTIKSLSYVGGNPSESGDMDGLGNGGQFAFMFYLNNGGNGMALYTVPEPSLISLVGIGLIGLLRTRRRR